MRRGALPRATSAGFTIVEVMIVLAVTGLLFVVVVASWSGRQHQSEFQTAAQDIRSSLQQTIADVQNGYYNNANDFSCTGTSTITLQNASSNQGSNQACVFLGKVIQFQVGDQATYRTYAVAGLRGQTVLSSANPTVIAPDGQNHTLLLTHDESEVHKLMSDLTIVSIKNSAGTSVGAIGFLSSLGSKTDGQYNSGSTQVSLYGVPTAASYISSQLAARAINANLPSATSKAVTMCLQSGSTDKFAIITIGSDSRQLAVDLRISEGCS